MTTTLIDGKAIAQKVKDDVKLEVSALYKQGIDVALAVVIVGENAASRVYVNSKKKACEALGIRSEEYSLPEETTQEELLALVNKLNEKSDVNGILVQLPLPSQIDSQKIIETISPSKDVDAFHAANVGKIMIGNYDLLPCTPAGCMDLIHSTGIQIQGKTCVVVGRSNIVGKPMAMLLLHENGTVTICHSKTTDLKAVCKTADILIAAVGVEKLITGDMIKEDAVVIDVGMNRNADGKLCGDVDFDSANGVAGYLTPVPGGVGPMTIATLMKNTVTAAKLQSKATKQSYS